jgi:heptaprenyl diphosphate synthase
MAVREVYAHPVTQATRDEARRWAEDAVASLAILPAGAIKQALSAFAEHIVSRTA